jgi:hypothetical protein
MQRPKLFHTLVVMGVALTGGSMTTMACSGGGGTTGENATCDPQHDPHCVYPTISAVCRPGTSCYPNISPPLAASDASNDRYATISPYLPPDASNDASNDHYPNISPYLPPDGG